MDIDSEKTSIVIHYGKIISVRGSVVDVAFENDLPPIYTLLHAEKDKQVSIEVLSQLASCRYFFFCHSLIPSLLGAALGTSHRFVENGRWGHRPRSTALVGVTTPGVILKCIL